ncbi:MAG: hypothetical protein OXD54_18225 [Candidatus Poribacteria bacterium]|nr:hypothetical protein [Candidatus Poribacteria bacterium]
MALHGEFYPARIVVGANSNDAFLCEDVGADVTEVARGIGLDSRIGHRFLRAGLGWGGSCYPKDTAALLGVAAQAGYEMPITEAARTVNFQQRIRIVQKLRDVLKTLSGKTIGILGLAFKPNTGDIREAPSLDIIRQLVAEGVNIRAHDPISIPKAQHAMSDIPVDFIEDVYIRHYISLIEMFVMTPRSEV